MASQAEARCELMDLPVNQCAHCKGIDLPKETEGLRIIQFLRARYDGRCVIDPGHQIMQDDDIGRVAHADNTRDSIGYACSNCVREITR